MKRLLTLALLACSLSARAQQWYVMSDTNGNWLDPITLVRPGNSNQLSAWLTLAGFSGGGPTNGVSAAVATNIAAVQAQLATNFMWTNVTLYVGNFTNFPTAVITNLFFTNGTGQNLVVSNLTVLGTQTYNNAAFTNLNVLGYLNVAGATTNNGLAVFNNAVLLNGNANITGGLVVFGLTTLDNILNLSTQPIVQVSSIGFSGPITITNALGGIGSGGLFADTNGNVSLSPQNAASPVIIFQPHFIGWGFTNVYGVGYLATWTNLGALVFGDSGWQIYQMSQVTPGDNVTLSLFDPTNSSVGANNAGGVSLAGTHKLKPTASQVETPSLIQYTPNATNVFGSSTVAGNIGISSVGTNFTAGAGTNALNSASFFSHSMVVGNKSLPTPYGIVIPAGTVAQGMIAAEPSVIWDTNPYILTNAVTVAKMWLTWSNGIGYSESLDGLTWQAPFTIITNGGSEGTCVKAGSLYHEYCETNFPPTGLGHYVSTNGVTGWTFVGATIVTNGSTWKNLTLGNCGVWYGGGTNWVMLFDAQGTGWPYVGFQEGLAQSLDGTNWVESTANPVIGSTGGTNFWQAGSCRPFKVGTNWYVGNNFSLRQTPSLPSEISLLTSWNLTNWTVCAGGFPIVPRILPQESPANDTGVNQSQTADAFFLDQGGTNTLIYHTSVDNQTNHFQLGLSVVYGMGMTNWVASLTNEFNVINGAVRMADNNFGRGLDIETDLTGLPHGWSDAPFTFTAPVTIQTLNVVSNSLFQGPTEIFNNSLSVVVNSGVEGDFSIGQNGVTSWKWRNIATSGDLYMLDSSGNFNFYISKTTGNAVIGANTHTGSPEATLQVAGTLEADGGVSSGALSQFQEVLVTNTINAATGEFLYGYVTNNLTVVNGVLTANLTQLLNYDTSLTIVTNAGAGVSGATVSLVGTDLGGQITINTGLTPATSSAICTITYDTAFPNTSFPVISPASATTSTLGFSPFAVGTTTGFTIRSGTTALTGSTTYVYNYVITGK